MSFAAYVTELLDPHRPLVISQLTQLSELTPAQIELLKRNWPLADPGRRRRILGELIELAEDDCLLNFDALFRLCLEDPDEELRCPAIEGLWECEEPWLLHRLVAMLREDVSEKVRVAAAQACGRFALLAELKELPPAEAAKVRRAMQEVIHDPGESLEVRRRAVEAIAFLSEPEVTAIISSSYQCDNPRMKASALHAMGHNGDPSWLPILLRELHSSHPELRYEAVIACGQIADESAVSAMVDLLEDPDPEVRMKTIEALSQIGGDLAKAHLRRYRFHPDEAVRASVNAALEELEFADDPLRFRFSN